MLAVLDTTTKSLSIKLAAAIATAQPTLVANYREESGGHENARSTATVANSTTEVAVVSAPIAGVTHTVDSILVSNLDSAAVTVIVMLKDSAGTDREVARKIIASGDGYLFGRIDPPVAVLDLTTKSLSFKLLGAVTTTALKVSANWHDESGGHKQPGNTTATSNNTTEVALVAAPPAGITRVIDSLTISNPDTVAATVLVILKDSAGTDRQIYRLAVGIGDGGVIPSGGDHGNLAGLADDDHTQYLLAAGTRGLTGAWDAGSWQIRAETFQSDVATGTAPFTVASTTRVTNLNVDNSDMVDGKHAEDLVGTAMAFTWMGF